MTLLNENTTKEKKFSSFFKSNLRNVLNVILLLENIMMDALPLHFPISHKLENDQHYTSTQILKMHFTFHEVVDLITFSRDVSCINLLIKNIMMDIVSSTFSKLNLKLNSRWLGCTNSRPLTSSKRYNEHMQEPSASSLCELVVVFRKCSNFPASPLCDGHRHMGRVRSNLSDLLSIAKLSFFFFFF